MEDLDTPASPVGEDANEWQQVGAETPEHVEESADEQLLSPPATQQPQEEEETVADEDNEARSPEPSAETEHTAAPIEINEMDPTEMHADTPEHIPNKQETGDSSTPTPKSPTKQLHTLTERKTAVIDSSDDEEAPKANEPSGNSPEETPASSKSKRMAVIDSDDSDSNAAKSPPPTEKEGREEAEEGGEPKADEDTDIRASKLMDDIFGENVDMDDDSDADGNTTKNDRKRAAAGSSDDDGGFIRADDGAESADERPSHRWDFDEMMAKKKKERKRTKRRRRDGTYDLISDADDQIKDLVESMMRAANQDRTSNESRQPAFQKQKLLPVVKQTLLRADYFEALLDNGMMSAVSEWLAPLPDKSLPSLEIRTTLLKILHDFPNLEQGILRQSGLGKAVMYLLKHPREAKENKLRAAKLIREWSRPIFQLESDYTSMSREERYERDFNQQKKKRRRDPEDEDSQPTSSSRSNPTTSEAAEGGAGTSVPGQSGFVPRARVPKPSMKAYVNRPTPIVDGRFSGPSKSRSANRFDIAQREFKERTKTRKAGRHIGVSIAGNKMEI